MQRIINTESSEFFLVNNSQGETNFHNLNTTLSEVVMTVGALAALVIIPFYREKIAKFLVRIKIPQLTPFLPSTWMLLPFAAMAGLIGIGDVVRPAILFVTLLTLAILIYQISVHVSKRNIGVIGVYMTVALIGLFTAYTFITFSYDAYGVRSWAYSEYLEFFIAYGLLVYTIDFMFHNVRHISP